MEGLNSKEVAALIDYIQANNSWENMYDVVKRGRIVCKYYDMFYDSRAGEMWSITFRSAGKKVSFSADENYDFKQRIYDFLDGRYIPESNQKVQ